MPEQKKQEIEKVAPIAQWLTQGKVVAAIKRALPQHLTPETMIQIAITTVQRSYQLMECTPLSIIGCVIEGSQLGLSFDKYLGQAYLVPFKNRNTGKKEAQLIIGYRGMVHLARNSGLVKTVSAEVVRAGETCTVEYGIARSLRHIPDFKLPNREKQETWEASYAVAQYTDGSEPDFTFMPREKVLAIKARSKSKDDGPWVTDEEEMWRKTAIRRLSKLLPQSPKLQAFHRAVAREEDLDMGLGGEPLIDLTSLQELDERPAIAEGPKRKSEKAAEQAPASSEQKQANTAPSTDKKQEDKTAASQEPQGEQDPFLTPDEVKTTMEFAMKNGWAIVDLKSYLKKTYDTEQLKDLRQSQLKKLKFTIENGTGTPQD